MLFLSVHVTAPAVAVNVAFVAVVAAARRMQICD